MSELKWFHLSQSNSGGYFIRNESVSDDVFIQAKTAKEAESKALEITSDHSEYCHCCGERWWVDFDECDGKSEPEIYRNKLSTEYAPYDRSNAHALLHHNDGSVTKFLPHGKKR